MISVVPQPEPADFDAKVRQPGTQYLRNSLCPSPKAFERHDFWRSCLPQLCSAYAEICAYSSLWLPSECSVDHFWPKATHPQLAYEWSNYRLASRRINRNKGDSEEVLDPFTVMEGWFVLDPATLWVHPGPDLDQDVRRGVQRTIDILKLNDDAFVNARFGILDDFLRDELPVTTIERRYPFMAFEIRRLGLHPRSGT